MTKISVWKSGNLKYTNYNFERICLYKFEPSCLGKYILLFYLKLIKETQNNNRTMSPEKHFNTQTQ